MPFPKFELLEHTIPLLSSMLLYPRSDCFLDSLTTPDYNSAFGKSEKRFGVTCDLSSEDLR
jgi:hypothetical protein